MLSGDAVLVLALQVLAEDAVGHLQRLQRRVGLEQAAVEAVHGPPAERGAGVHGAEQRQQLLPQRRPGRVEKLAVGPFGQQVLQQLGRVGEPLPHVVAEEHEQQPVEHLLRQPHQPPARAGEARRAFPVAGQQLGIQPVAQGTVFLVERILDLPVAEPPLLDQPEQHGPAAARQQRVAVEQPGEQEAVEPRGLGPRQQPGAARALEQVARLDDEADVLLPPAVIPVQPELVHVRHDGPGGQHRLATHHAAAGEGEVVQRLLLQRPRVALAPLRGIERRVDILVFAQHLRDPWLPGAELPRRQVCLPRAAGGAGAGHVELGPQRVALARRNLAGLGIAPGVAEELPDEGGFRAAFPKVVARMPPL